MGIFFQNFEKFENFENVELKFPKSEANFDVERGILSYNFQSRKQILTLKEVYSPLFNLGVILDPQFPMCDKFKNQTKYQILGWDTSPVLSINQISSS